ncbi:alpha-beta hydrolase superfamily lysophospholipase [Chryseobacterium sediminis]|uniref:Alpha-beta hydrolase superfamily lysophospholipase n=1 Tax=Chryseobacterium sediminis TaxID=1679494 RepID=A0ABR6PUC5_9FLAO|nr:alpha/beta fold hydrolase [Chryseobacterium sediminis]MBB6329116.1 alpha-beta hydrolase superfamily lysophospholipase [Chryseobacterium sediminis]
MKSQKSAYLPSKINSESQLFHTLFSPETAKATLLIVHGMQEHSGRYAEIAEYFANHGIAVLTYDHLGHGKSVKEKKDIGFFQLEKPDERLIADAEMMADHLAEQFPEVPHFIMGHSMGSFITRCLLQKASNKFAGAIITGTGGPLPGIDLLRAYLSLTNAIAPHHRTFLNSVFTSVNNKHFKKDKDFSDTSWLSINPKNRKAFEQDELCGIPFTHNAFYTLFTIYKKATARNWASSISKSFPFLFVSGQNDPIGDFGKGVMHTVNHLKADGFQHVDVKIYPEMRHEILNEEIREEVLNEIYHWIIKN